jgi:hypothetical protein
MAQADRGSISGRVLDQSGAAVPGSRIQIIERTTGIRSETTTNSAGLYTVPNLPAGSYKASFSTKGFKTANRMEIIVSVGQAIRLDVALETGEITETITVTSASTSMKSGDPSLATVIGGGVVQDLPLSISGGRRIESFGYALAPAVEGDTWSSHIAGTPDFTKEVLIDGLSATSQIQGNVLESSPTMDSIQEFSVQTTGFSAEYGHAGGGVFSFALAHGTNELNGSAYYYGRNEALNANTWMNNWQSSLSPDSQAYKRARDRQSVIGGSAGGPVVIPGLYDGRNRTFVFGTFEHYEQEELQVGKMDRTVPVPEFLEGDFSRLLTKTQIGVDALSRPIYAGQIFDPGTMRRVGTQWVSEPFPNNMIPKGRMSVVSGKVIDIFKRQYRPMISGPLSNNSAGPQYESPWFHQSQLTMKGDHAFSSAIKLTGSFIWTERPRMLLDEGGIWDPRAAEGSGGPLARARKQEVTSRALRLTVDWNIRPNLVAATSFVFNRYRNPSLSAQSEGNWQRYLGLQESTSAGLFPEIRFGPPVNGIGTTAIGYGSSGFYVGNNYIASGSVDWNRGSHNLKFGGEFWTQQMNSHSGLDVLSFGFSPTQTGIPGYSWSNRVGLGFASFFLGEAERANKAVPFDLYGRRKYIAFFFQDDYRVNKSLTLNLGLRWEQTQPLSEKYGRWASFNPALMNTALGVKGALEFLPGPGGSFEKSKDWKEFGPRLGAAYRMGDRFVARAGYGLSYIPSGMNYWSGTPYGFAPGYRGTNNQSPSLNLPKFNWDQGYPDNYQAPVRDPNALVYGTVSIDERSLFAGYTHQYNVGLQYEISRGTVLEAALMGNQGRRLHNGALKRNQPLKAAYQDPSVDPWAWIWDPDSAAAAGVRYPYDGFSNFAGVALQPFPQVASETGGPLYFVGVPEGSSGYKSLQLSLSRRMSHGLAAQISYNLSQAVGNSETGFDESWDSSAGIQDANNPGESAGTVVSYDQTHVLKGCVEFEMPFGKSRRFLSNSGRAINSILGGWKITGIFRYNSGNPLGVYPDVWYPGWEGAIYADYNPNINLDGQFDSKSFDPGLPNAPGNKYFNPAAFSNPQGHKLGNGKRLYAELRGFGYASEDIGLLKDFQFKERARIQLRAEFLNAFNRHHFADPNTNIGNSATFGYVTAVTGTPRVIQLGLRMDW